MLSTTPKISSYIENNFSTHFEEVVKNTNPKLIVEFGILHGYSLQLFTDFSDDSCKIHAYDLFEKFPYNAADYDTIVNKFKKHSKVEVKRMDFFDGHNLYQDGEIDIIHIDIANNGDTFQFAIENYFKKLSSKGVMILEGGSKERDEVEWMNRFEKRKINPYLEEIKNEYSVKIIEEYPSLTIIKKLDK